MPKAVLSPQVAAAVLSQRAKAKGGMAAMFAGQIAADVETWGGEGIFLCVELDSVTGKQLLSQGLIKAPNKQG